jgi:hypothetical protein
MDWLELQILNHPSIPNGPSRSHTWNRLPIPAA